MKVSHEIQSFRGYRRMNHYLKEDSRLQIFRKPTGFVLTYIPVVIL